MKAVPLGPKDLVCPLHRQKMVKVCHTCPMWMSIRGKHPQTGADVDDWNCALAWGPVLAVNAAREMSMVSKEVSVMRSDNRKAHDEHVTMAAIAVQRSNDTIENTIAKYALSSPPSHQIPYSHVSALPAPEAAE